MGKTWLQMHPSFFPQLLAGLAAALRRAALTALASYRIVISDLLRRRPIWFGGNDRAEASMDEFYRWLGTKKCGQIRLAVMDMWKPFRNSAARHIPNGAIQAADFPPSIRR